MTTALRAYRLTAAGGSFVTCTLDDIDDGDVLVRVAFSDVNFKDALAATGRAPILRRPTCIGGIDFSGTVVSSADPRFAPGEPVAAVGFQLGVSHDGGYAEYARVPGEWLVKLPPTLSLWEVMALGTAGFTAALAIIRMEQNGCRPANGPVIVSGATGGVGSIAVAILARLGYDAVALTGKPDANDYLKMLGASETLRRQEIDPTKIKPLGEARWAGAIDNLGGDVLAWMTSTMKINGVIASIGLVQSASVTTSVMPFILRGVSLLGINSTDSPTEHVRHEVWRRLADDMKPSMLERIAETIPFDQLPSGFERVMNGSVRGRIVVRIG